MTTDDFERSPQFEELVALVRQKLPADEQTEAIEGLREFFRMLAPMTDEQREQVVAYVETYVKTAFLPAREAAPRDADVHLPDRDLAYFAPAQFRARKGAAPMKLWNPKC